jgi:hypothetical protein
MDNNRSFRDSVVRAAALIGLLLVLILGAWGIILLAFNLPTIASNVGSSIVSLFNYAPATTTPSNNNQQIGVIAVTAPASVTSGSSFSVSWKAENADDSYSYTVSYACQDGLSIKAPNGNGSYQNVSCSTPFNFVGASSKMTLIANTIGTASVPATIVVSATHAGNNTLIASGSAVVNVTKTTANTPATGSGTTYVPANNTATLYGSADLAVRILSINSLSSVQNRVSMQFVVENVGTNVAPAGWMFTANLPVGYSYVYSSATQQALYPGDKIVYTLGFNSAVNNQYCTQQYPNQNCPWYNQPYHPYPYQGICYRYDGYQNLPVACPSDINPNYDYYHLNDGYNYQYNYGSGSYSGNVVTITVDPRNFVWDQNRYNNTASINSPLY